MGGRERQNTAEDKDTSQGEETNPLSRTWGRTKRNHVEKKLLCSSGSSWSFVKNRVLRREAQTEPDVVRILTGTTLVPVRTNPEGSVGGSRLLVVTNNSCVSCIVRDAEWSLL